MFWLTPSAIVLWLRHTTLFELSGINESVAIPLVPFLLMLLAVRVSKAASFLTHSHSNTSTFAHSDMGYRHLLALKADIQ